MRVVSPFMLTEILASYQSDHQNAMLRIQALTRSFSSAAWLIKATDWSQSTRRCAKVFLTHEHLHKSTHELRHRRKERYSNTVVSMTHGTKQHTPHTNSPKGMTHFHAHVNQTKYNFLSILDTHSPTIR